MKELPLVRSSERGSFKNCPQQWYWSYVEELVPVGTEFDARAFGTGIHLAMAEYYIPGKVRGRPLLDTWGEWLEETRRALTLTEKDRKKWDQGGKEEFAEMAELGTALLTEYGKEYAFVPAKGTEAHEVCDPEWEVICREEPFRANLGGAIAVGTVDMVIRNQEGEIWIVDHKTGKGFPNEWWYRLDDQGGSYGAIATHVLRGKGMIGPKERVKGIIFNFIRKAKPDERPKNADGLATNKPKKEHYAKAIAEDICGDARSEERDSTQASLMKETLKFLEAEALALELVVVGDVSAVQPPPLFQRYKIERTRSQQKHQLQRVKDDVKVMSMVREGEIPVLKAPGKLCPYCDFAQLCELDESGGDTESMKELLFKTRDPYHDHREGADNSKLSVQADKELKR